MTGVQTCALPISGLASNGVFAVHADTGVVTQTTAVTATNSLTATNELLVVMTGA